MLLLLCRLVVKNWQELIWQAFFQQSAEHHAHKSLELLQRMALSTLYDGLPTSILYDQLITEQFRSQCTEVGGPPETTQSHISAFTVNVT